MLIGSKKKGEEGQKYWRCSSFFGKQGAEIEGRTFTIIRPDRGSTKPYNIRRRKKPWERPMLCTDIRVSASEPELAFIRAWNRLVDKRERYLPEWQKAIEGEDLLMAYRARELMGLVEKIERIDRIPYELVLKTLNHIEIGIDGELDVVFLAGRPTAMWIR